MSQAKRLEVRIPCGPVELRGEIGLPEGALGLVLFAHGSGSSRLSPRNRAVAATLEEAGCATLLFDLLSPAEAEDRRNVFEVALLGQRLMHATTWRYEVPGVRELPVGYFGASTGAAAALIAAAELGEAVAAVVSRGGRPDLAAEWLRRVRAPTLLLVGSLDFQVIELNRRAQAMLRCENRLTVVEGASHLFEEPGTLERVADEAAAGFRGHFQQPKN